MDTVKLHIEIEKENYFLVKKFLENIKGIVKIEEEDELLNSFLVMEEDFFSGKLDVVSEEDFKKSAKEKICKFYSQK